MCLLSIATADDGEESLSGPPAVAMISSDSLHGAGGNDVGEAQSISRLSLNSLNKRRTNNIIHVSGRLFRILTPKLTETRIDSKKDMETELKNACEVLIQEQIQTIALPLVEFNARINDVGHENFKNESFMQSESINKLNLDFLQSIRSSVPMLCAKMRLYLTNRVPDSGSNTQQHAASGTSTHETSQSNNTTFHVLFRPIHVSLVESVAQLWSLFREFGVHHDFVSKNDLDKEISGIVEKLQEMEYTDIIAEFFPKSLEA